MPERIDTERLILRRFARGDGDAVARVWRDRAVWRALRPGASFDREFARQRFEHHLRHWELYGFGLWAAFERASGELAGWTGPSHPLWIPELADAVELGWALRRGFWGRGLAREGASAALSATFAGLGVEEVVSLIAWENERSVAVAIRLGMQATRMVAVPFGEAELRVYALRRSEWAADEEGSVGATST